MMIIHLGGPSRAPRAIHLIGFLAHCVGFNRVVAGTPCGCRISVDCIQALPVSSGSLKTSSSPGFVSLNAFFQGLFEGIILS